MGSHPLCGAGAGTYLRTGVDGRLITYAVTVSREEPWWVAIVDGLPGGATETRRLDQMEVEVRDLISALTDTAEDSFDLEWTYALSPNLDRPVQQFLKARARREAAEQDYTKAQEQAVSALTSAHVSVRDAAELLGLSYQRVAQIRPRRTADRSRKSPRPATSG